jgi:N-formylglutamate deformylase
MSAGPTSEWLAIVRGRAPLIVSIPHAGTQLAHISQQVKSQWLATLDADWYVDRLYDFAAEFDATIVATRISRTVIDVNRDRESRNLYPGMATTELVPTTTFDGVALYEPQYLPSEDEQGARRDRYFDPYHAALREEIARLLELHAQVVLYDAHSIRSRVPRLFDGELPLFNIGTYDGRSCSGQLATSVASVCAAYSSEFVVNGRFKGGAITRTYGRPDTGVHAIQMELACRAYMDEPLQSLTPTNWPPQYSLERADPVRAVLRRVLEHCLDFGSAGGSR